MKFLIKIIVFVILNKGLLRVLKELCFVNNAICNKAFAAGRRIHCEHRNINSNLSGLLLIGHIVLFRQAYEGKMKTVDILEKNLTIATLKMYTEIVVKCFE